MTALWELTWQALGLGSIYAMAALGFVVIFRSTGVFNFAQGSYMGLAAYLALTASTSWGMPYLLAGGVAIVLVGLVSAAIFASAIRPLTGRQWWAPVMITIAVSIVVDACFGIVWNGSGGRLDPPWYPKLVSVGGGVSVSTGAFINVVEAAVLILGMHLLLSRTTFGVRLRGCAERPGLAAQAGIRVSRYLVVAWVIGGIAAGFAGLAYATNNLVTPEVAALGLKAFPAALLGGFDSVPGVAAGAFVVAFAEVSAVLWLGSAAGDAAVFGLLLVLLVVRPYGLFGSSAVARA